jgi:O-antigen ligase
MTIPLLALATVVLGVAAAGFVIRPGATILPIYAATLPIASVVKLSVPLPSPFNTLSSMLGGAAIVACVAHLLLYRRGRPPTLAMTGWFALLAWSTVTLFWAIDPAVARSTLLVAASLVLLTTLVGLLPLDGVDIDALRLAIIASGIAVGLYASFLLLSGSALPTHGASQRLSLATNPSDTDPNILAASLLMPLLLSVERIVVGRSHILSAVIWRWVGVAGAFFSFLAILFTGSRGGLLAAIVGFVWVLASCRSLPPARRTVRLVALAMLAILSASIVVLLVGATVSPTSAVGRLLTSDSIKRITSTSNGSSGRTEIWQAGLLACDTYCGLGSGLGTFPDAYNQAFAFSSGARNVGANRPAHNIYLSMAVELGLIGLTLFGIALALEWLSLSRPSMWREVPALKGVLVSVLIANFFLSAIWFKYFWLVFLLIRVAEGVGSTEPRRYALTRGRRLGAGISAPI